MNPPPPPPPPPGRAPMPPIDSAKGPAKDSATAPAQEPTPPPATLAARVTFEPGGYAQFSGQKVAPAQRLQMLVGVFVRDQWRTVKSKLFAGLFLLPMLVMAAIAIARAKLSIDGIKVPHAEECQWVAQLLHYQTTIGAGLVLLGMATQVSPLIARDGHEGALLLYFSRPVLRPHYLLARLLAAWAGSAVLLAGPAVLLVLVLLSQYGLQIGGCPFPDSLTALWWMALAVAQVLASAAIALLACVVALAAGVVVKNPSSAPLGFGGIILASTAASWVLQAAYGRDSAARAVDLHHALSSLWTLLSFPLDPAHPPRLALLGAAGGLVLWIALAGGAWYVLQRFLANPPLGKGRA